MGELTFDNELFRLYATYATVVVLKMMALSFVTSYKRITKKVKLLCFSVQIFRTNANVVSKACKACKALHYWQICHTEIVRYR